MNTAASELPCPMNHIFVDYENVQAIAPEIFVSKTVRLTLLLGAQKTKLEAALVEKLFRHAASVELIKLEMSGKNALDFALVYYLGRAVAAEPTDYFHIVSKDKGYDPLIEHLRRGKIRVRRHNDFSTLTFSAPKKTPANPALLNSRPVKLEPKSNPKPKIYSSKNVKTGDWGKEIIEQLHKQTNR